MRHGRLQARAVWVLLAALLVGPPASAAPGAVEPARIAILIDDVGNDLAQGRRVIRLSAPVALAILPHTAFGARLAREAHRQRKEILLHLPMQPLREEDPGPGRIDVGMPAREIALTLDYNLSTVPHAVGVNNHMGSRATRDEPTMRALLQALHSRGRLFYLDSRTVDASPAARLGRTLGLPVLARDVFLDNDLNQASIRRRLDEATHLARTRGHAIAIGHPHAATLSQLEAWLPTLARQNVRVVGLSELLERINRGSNHGERTRTVGAGL